MTLKSQLLTNAIYFLIFFRVLTLDLHCRGVGAEEGLAAEEGLEE